MTIDNKSNLSFKGVEAKVKARFDRLVENENLTRHDMLEHLIAHYELMSLDLNEQQILLLKQAKHIAPVTYSNNVKKRVLKVADNIVKSSQDNADIDINNKNSRLSADKRANILLHEITEANNRTKNWYNKIYISNSAFKKFAESKRENEEIKTAFSKSTIDRCLERNRVMLEEHHNKYKLDKKHNLLAFHERAKIEKESTKQ
jgi:hypothetical protein